MAQGVLVVAEQIDGDFMDKSEGWILPFTICGCVIAAVIMAAMPALTRSKSIDARTMDSLLAVQNMEIRESMDSTTYNWLKESGYILDISKDYLPENQGL